MNNKFILWIRGWHSCFSWIFQMFWKECLTDLHFNDLPRHPQDFIAFAERWNGRLAMLSVLIILQLELIYKAGIWQILGFV